MGSRSNSPDRIIDWVCHQHNGIGEDFDLFKANVLGGSRKQTPAHIQARHEIAQILVKRTNLPVEYIGRLLGGKQARLGQGIFKDVL